MRMRSRITAERPVTDQDTGRRMIPPDQAAYLGQFPEMPGMLLTVKPAELAYSLVDPLEDDEDLCEQIRSAMERNSTFRGKGKLKGCPRQDGKLDVHRMKTLCRELVKMAELGFVRVRKGQVPTLEQVDAMPGRYLLNPGSTIPNGQPRYEDSLEDYVQNLNSRGG